MGFTQHLRARGETGLAALLDARGELAAPPPASVRALAARAAGRASVERTIAALDARTPEGAPVDLPGALAAHLADPGTIAHLLQQGPAAARRVLDALTWGPPVGQAPQGTPEAPSPARAAVQWLLRHGLLAMS